MDDTIPVVMPQAAICPVLKSYPRKTNTVYHKLNIEFSMPEKLNETVSKPDRHHILNMRRGIEENQVIFKFSIQE